MKKRTAGIVMLAVMLSLAACGNTKTSSDTAAAGTSAAKESSSSAAQSQAAAGMHHAEIVIKDYGTVTVELDGETAPITVDNFIGLAKDGFYDGLTFHRIIDGFMIQGGDPKGNGTGGADKTIKGEFSENGVENKISHKAGVISMARAQDPDSASSQFFITVADATFLDGQYAAFGHVTDGMDVAEQIAKDAEPVDGNGTIPPEAQPVIETIRILD
ncbi:MAG: peptidylprolyl isomerase [Eubacterium sp.]|nr:peptidylprolyl isomerase [Eubacterium sp.]